VLARERRAKASAKRDIEKVELVGVSLSRLARESRPRQKFQQLDNLLQADSIYALARVR
jgi:hypothetical protein